MDKEQKPILVTAEQLVGKIDNEGLSYAVVHYYGRNIKCTDDPKFETLWKTAYDAIEALEVHVLTIEK